MQNADVLEIRGHVHAAYLRMRAEMRGPPVDGYENIELVYSTPSLSL